MYREGEIIEITCPDCKTLNKYQYHTPERMGEIIKKNGGKGEMLGYLKCRECNRPLEWSEENE